MFKKIAVCVLCFVLLFSVCVYAQDSQTQTDASSNTSEAQVEMPVRGRGGRMGGGPPGGMGGNMQPPEMPTDENNETMQRPQMPSGTPFDNNMNNETQNNEIQNEEIAQEAADNTESAFGFFYQYSTPVFSLVLLALAFVFVMFYKRRNY